LTLYLDDELSGDDLAAVEAHLDDCPVCSALADSERAFLDAVRGVGPLEEVQETLRDRVATLVGDAPGAEVAPPALRRHVERILAGRGGASALGGWRPAAMILVVVALLAFLVVPVLVERRDHARFASLAVETHLRHLGGRLPLEVESKAPAEIAHWFVGKVPFSLELPTYQESSGQDRLYEPVGGRLVAFEDDYAAFVAYRMSSRPISLLVTSCTAAAPSGGEEIVSNGITFHFESIDGLKVITWSDRGLSYALVSDLEERGQASCLVCHAGTKDRNFVDALRPKV
jgi:anti-sigma factor RsiW